MITFTLTGAPASEPVSAEDLRLHAHLDDNGDDADIESKLLTARHLIEQATGRSLIAQTWTAYLRSWPEPEADGLIHIRLAPFPASVASVAVDGVALDSALYQLKGDELIVLAADLESIPEGDDLDDGVLITFTSSAGAIAAPPLVTAIKILGAHLYEHREPVTVDQMMGVFGLGHILQTYRVMRELN